MADRPFVVVPLVILTLLSIFPALSHLLLSALSIPARLGPPLALRAGGGLLLALGASFLAWVFKYRSPGEVLASTYLSMRQAVRRAPLAPRDEPLVLQGPQRHVRHPMYFAVVVMLFGWWLALDRTLLLFLALLVLLWYNLVVIRFEERELRQLFGERYEAYARAVPKMLPSLKPRWPPEDGC